MSAIAVDALEQSKNFIQRLIISEAKSESCEVSRAEEIRDSLCSEFVKLVPISKIDISVVSGELNPKYSTCGLFYWIPSNKKQKKAVK